MEVQLPRGWHDVVEDAARFEHRLDDRSRDWEDLLVSIGAQLDTLAGATLRVLPVVELTNRGQLPRGVSASDVRRQIARVSRTFQQLESAAGELRTGASHFGDVKRLASRLVADIGIVDGALGPSSVDGAWRVPMDGSALR